VPKQINDFFKGGFAGEFENIIAAVDQPSFLPPDIAKSGICGYDSFQSF
jgi:hypothetical protein